MSYNFDFAMSATLSPLVLEEMVRKVVEEQTGKKVDKVAFKIGKQYDMHNDGYSVFEGCTVTFITSSMAR